MKKFSALLSFLFSFAFLWGTSPVPYSGKIDIRGVNYFGEGQFAFLCMMETAPPIGETEARREKRSRCRFRMGGTVFYWVGRE